MNTRSMIRSGWRCGARMLPALLLTTGGCMGGAAMEVQSPQRLAVEIRSVLGAERPSPEYHRARLRIQEMGPEVDWILVGVIEDRRARVEMRADALILLADRRSPIAIPTLERALRYDNERLRSAAVLGLSRLAPTSEFAGDLIRRATSDRSRAVRMNALHSLDVTDIETLRAVIEREQDREVRHVGLQLVSLAEARGAPLVADRRGALRTAAGETEPQIVFRPVVTDSATEVASGDLRLELPDGPDIPLAASARVVGNVVPAFFSPDRSAVVFEDDGQIRVVDVGSREQVTVGPGIAPRPIPFTHHFVFLREVAGGRRQEAEGTAILYDVFRGSFGGDEPERIGQLRAVADPQRHGAESPVRWMVVAEGSEGFVLRGDSLETFTLPGPVLGPRAGR
jgi:hypothetical protein